jgi:hypothetical protein
MGVGENQSVVYEEEAKTVHVAMREWERKRDKG